MGADDTDVDEDRFRRRRFLRWSRDFGCQAGRWERALSTPSCPNSVAPVATLLVQVRATSTQVGASFVKFSGLSPSVNPVDPERPPDSGRILPHAPH